MFGRCFFVHLAILRNEIGWFDKVDNTSSMLASQLESDSTLLRTIVVDRSTILLENFGLVVTSFIISFILNWRLTLVVLATYPLIISGHISEVNTQFIAFYISFTFKHFRFFIFFFVVVVFVRNFSCKAME